MRQRRCFRRRPGFYFLYEVVHTILYLQRINRMAAISCGDRNGKTEVQYREVFHSVLWENTGASKPALILMRAIWATSRFSKAAS